MKHLKPILGIGILAIATFFVVVAADHIDAPAVEGTQNDITDFYSFRGQNTDNLVFVANVQGLLAPDATANAEFSESTLIEFNIDNDGDSVEDLVIQAIPRDGLMYVFGPYAPSSTGLNSTIDADVTPAMAVAITPYSSQQPIVSSSNGITAFAGPRDDPFFMDFTRFTEILGGMESEFRDNGVDTFAGTNVLSVVVEVPKSMLGAGGNATSINAWVETKQKQ